MADFTTAIKVLEAALESAYDARAYMLDENQKLQRQVAEKADEIAKNDLKIANYQRSIELLREAQHVE